MKTLQEIKDEIAREQEYVNWDDYAEDWNLDDTVIDAIAKRYAIEKVKSAFMAIMEYGNG